jgi:hypothetical protein
VNVGMNAVKIGEDFAINIRNYTVQLLLTFGVHLSINAG